MSDDLVKRLRIGIHTSEDVCALRDEAADRIEKLGAENAELRSQINTVQIAAKYAAKIRDERIEKLEAALREIAASAWDCNGKTCEHCQPNSCQNAFIARKALEGKDG